MIPHTRSSSQLPPRPSGVDRNRYRFAVLSTSTSRNGKSPADLLSPASRRSAELSSYESADPSTEGLRLPGVFGLRQHPDHGLGSGRPDEHTASLLEFRVDGHDLLFDRPRQPPIRDAD